MGIDAGSSLIKGSGMKFLRNLIENVQIHFTSTQWDGSATVEVWVEASSCWCERVFSYVTATDFGQSTERMCQMCEATFFSALRTAPREAGKTILCVCVLKQYE